MADSPQHHIAGEVEDKQKAHTCDITNVLHYMLQ